MPVYTKHTVAQEYVYHLSDTVIVISREGTWQTFHFVVSLTRIHRLSIISVRGPLTDPLSTTLTGRVK